MSALISDANKTFDSRSFGILTTCERHADMYILSFHQQLICQLGKGDALRASALNINTKIAQAQLQAFAHIKRRNDGTGRGAAHKYCN